MGISFFEKMVGQLEDPGGARHPVRFEVKAEAAELDGFWRGEGGRLTGVIDAPPWAERAPLEGRLEIGPREIVYEIEFEAGASSTRYALRGLKEPSVAHPIESMTRMEARLYELGADGRGARREVGSGTMHFELTDLPGFIASWWPTSSLERERRAARSDGGEEAPAPQEEWSSRERRLVEALAAATIEAGRRVPGFDAETMSRIWRQVATMPQMARTGWRLGLAWLDVESMVRRLRPFAALGVDEARELLATMGSRARLVDLLTAPIKAAHFGRPDYLDGIGHPPPREIAPEPEPRHMRRVIAPESLGERTELRAHVAVIGTGAGGAAVAAGLARRGLAVAMLEEGRYRRRQDFVGAPMERIGRMYRYGAMNFALGTPVVVPQGRVVGGTTTINSGTCFATPDAVLEEWRRDLGFPSDFEPARYHRHSEEVAEMLGVGPGAPEALGRIAEVIGRGADALGDAHGPLPRNAPGCTGAGECIFGCPEGAKRSTDRTWVPAALRAGAELYVGMPVTRILMDGRRAVAVEARGTGRDGRSRLLRVVADRVVVACGSLLSPILLRDNGVHHPMIGRNLSVHPGLGVIARMDEELAPWETIPQGYGIEALGDEGIRFEGYYLPPALTAAQMPWTGAELTRWMDDFARLAQFGFMVRDRGDGRVHRGVDGRPVMSYRLGPVSIRRLVRGSAYLSRLFLAAGASEVMVGFGRDPVVRTEADARALEEQSWSPLDFAVLGAHPLGTCRMGPDPRRAVVDFDHRVWGTDNLHVVDGSAVPTSLGVNPQMTIMAMALRAAERIGAELGAG
jgi:choline dehydrogenase-like flavoprotein